MSSSNVISIEVVGLVNQKNPAAVFAAAESFPLVIHWSSLNGDVL
jgi:hypothetical protein